MEISNKNLAIIMTIFFFITTILVTMVYIELNTPELIVDDIDLSNRWGFIKSAVYENHSEALYFVVKTQGRTPEEIAETTFHELAHYYAIEQEEHFCK